MKTMMEYEVFIHPCTISPLLRQIHRTVKKFKASSYREAINILKAFNENGSWIAEYETLKLCNTEQLNEPLEQTPHSANRSR